MAASAELSQIPQAYRGGAISWDPFTGVMGLYDIHTYIYICIVVEVCVRVYVYVYVWAFGLGFRQMRECLHHLGPPRYCNS